MRIGRGLLMPAAAEVRQMLHRIKLDNAARAMQLQVRGGGGAEENGKGRNCSSQAAAFRRMAELAESDAFVYSAAEAQHQHQQQQQQRRIDNLMKGHSSGESLFAVTAHGPFDPEE